MNTNKILLTSFVAFILFLMLVGLLSISYFARQRQIITNYAIDPEVEKLYGEYKKDEIIVKFKQPLSDQVSLDDIQKESTREARPFSQFMNMVGMGEEAPVPDSLIKLNELFPLVSVDKAFVIGEQNVKGVSSDNTSERDKTPLDSVYTITFKSEIPVIQLSQELSKRSDIEYAEPNYIVKINAIPNDPGFVTQWGLHTTGEFGGKADADIDAPEAWDLTVGDTETIIVAVLDTGVDTGHEDLTSRIWRNTDEPVFNGIDDDNNGFIDDVHGWNFLNDNYNISDSQGHGTHVSGIIGAERGNGRGIAGVADKVKIMPIKFLNSNGEGTLQDAAQGVVYAADNGARVVNCSFGVFAITPPQALYQAIQYARTKGVIVVAAAGNEGVDIGEVGNYTYPANYDLDNIITVASTTLSDRLSSFSNYSKLYVDLAAPGSDIVSTLPDNKYNVKSGTSMATPFVTGSVAVAMSHYPLATITQIREYILSSVDKLTDLTNDVLTGGRLNLHKIVSAVPTQIPTATSIPTPLISATVTPTIPVFITLSPTQLPTPTGIPTLIPTLPDECWMRIYGDADCDKNISVLDYVCWSQTLITGNLPANCKTADFNINGRVDVLDYAIWFNYYLENFKHL